MKDIQSAGRRFIHKAKTYNAFLAIGCLFLSIGMAPHLTAQPPDAVQSIRDLNLGYLLIRLPASRAKIDTLTAIVHRTDDPEKKARWQKQLDDTVEERDRMHQEYIQAFKTEYHFSRTGFFYDYEGHQLHTAQFFDTAGERISNDSLTLLPVFYLHFERTEQSHIEALVIYDRQGQRIPAPFPNNFTRGGLSFLFVKIAEKKFAAWRVGKINKKFSRFYAERA